MGSWYITNILYSLFVLIIDFLILYTYLLLSNKIKAKKIALIADSLKRSYRLENSEIEEEDDEQRVKFLRRHKEYRRLADE